MKPSTQPFRSADGRYIGVAVGELNGDADGQPGLEALFQHFLDYGFKGWEKINGQFLLVLFDQQEKTTHLINDRYGSQTAYYARASSTLFFSTRIRDLVRLLPSRPSFSHLGVAELMCFGHHLGNGTLFDGVTCLPPGSLLTFHRSRISDHRYWRAVYTPDSAITEAELADSLATAAARQIRSGGRKGALLSGGLDSRAVVHQAWKSGCEVQTFTIGLPNSMDVVYADRISSRLGIPHTHLPIKPEKWARSLATAADLVEGEADIQHFISVQFHERIGESCDTIFAGTFGDVLMGSMVERGYLGKLSQSEEAACAFRFSLQHSVELLATVFRAERWNELNTMCRAAVVDSLSGNSNELTSDRLTAWNIENRQCRFIFMGPRSDRLRFNVRSPFLDNDFVDCSLRVPARQRLGEAFYLRALWILMPELRDIPWQKTGLPPDPDAKFQAAYKIVSKVKRRLGIGLRGSFVNFGFLIRHAFRADELSDFMVRRQRQWHEIISRSAVERIIADHFHGRRDHSRLITKFLTLAYTEDAFSP
jgi:asparagine synthase (glutamine-hydrolysing)